MGGKWISNMWSMKQWENILWAVKDIPASHETEIFRVNI